jgi:hypothetical protein
MGRVDEDEVGVFQKRPVSGEDRLIAQIPNMLNEPAVGKVLVLEVRGQRHPPLLPWSAEGSPVKQVKGNDLSGWWKESLHGKRRQAESGSNFNDEPWLRRQNQAGQEPIMLARPEIESGIVLPRAHIRKTAFPGVANRFQR